MPSQLNISQGLPSVKSLAGQAHHLSDPAGPDCVLSLRPVLLLDSTCMRLTVQGVKPRTNSKPGFVHVCPHFTTPTFPRP